MNNLGLFFPLAALLTSSAFANTSINICNRNEVGNAIAEAVKAPSCQTVSVQAMASLTELYIYDQGAVSGGFSDDAFQGLPSLKTLWFDKPVVTSFPPHLLHGLNSLTEFVIIDGEDGYISDLPADLFQRLTNLSRIYLSHGGIKNIPPELFLGLTNLAELDLSQNEIVSLPENIFQGLASLSKLNLSENLISTLPKNAFQGLSDLSVLQLGELNKKFDKPLVLPPGIFRDLAKLSQLDLSFQSDVEFSPSCVLSRTVDLPSDLFQGLTNLTKLNLGAYGFKNLPVNEFQNLTNLTELNLEDNCISNLTKDMFLGIEHLTYLNLNDVSLGGLNLSPDFFQELRMLAELHLEVNVIKSIPNGEFKELKNLTSLYIDGESEGRPLLISLSAAGLSSSIKVYGYNILLDP